MYMTESRTKFICIPLQQQLSFHPQCKLHPQDAGTLTGPLNDKLHKLVYKLHSLAVCQQTKINSLLTFCDTLYYCTTVLHGYCNILQINQDLHIYNVQCTKVLTILEKEKNKYSQYSQTEYINFLFELHYTSAYLA